jgi:GTPase involved in cell partitioning and DNA repair
MIDCLIGDGLTGAKGRDVFIRVPCGTVVTEKINDGMYNNLVMHYVIVHGCPSCIIYM